MNILRSAFARVVKDPDLQEDSKRLMIVSEYVSAEECTKMLNDILNQPDPIIKEFAKYIKL